MAHRVKPLIVFDDKGIFPDPNDVAGKDPAGFFGSAYRKIK